MLYRERAGIMSDKVIRPPKGSVEQDIAKGLAILFVIFLHSVQLKSSAMEIVLAFGGYAMPFFFLMSGYIVLTVK